MGGPARSGARRVQEQPVEYEQTIDLGIVNLQIDGETVSLGNDNLPVSFHKTKPAICIVKPNDLKNFENDQLAGLALENVKYAIELTLQPDGSWKGVCNTAPDAARGGGRPMPTARGAVGPGGQGGGQVKGVYVFLRKAIGE